MTPDEEGTPDLDLDPRETVCPNCRLVHWTAVPCASFECVG